MGQTVKTTALLSDDADLYLKGAGTKVETAGSTAEITPSGVKGEITLTGGKTPSPAAATAGRDAITTRLNALREQISLWSSSSNENLRERAKGLQAEADALAPLAAVTSEVQLDTRTPSQLIAMNGGIVKLTKVQTRRQPARS